MRHFAIRNACLSLCAPAHPRTSYGKMTVANQQMANWLMLRIDYGKLAYGELEYGETTSYLNQLYAIESKVLRVS